MRRLITRGHVFGLCYSSRSLVSSMSAKFKPVTHCIFDMDGLLIDTEQLYTRVFNQILSPYGKEFTWANKGDTMGFHTSKLVLYIINTFELPMTPEELSATLAVEYAKIFPTTQLLPGAERLLRHLKKHNVPIALATSSSADSFALKTKHLMEVFDLFHHRVLGGSDPEVKNGKPHPDVFLVAAKRFDDNPDPSQCLVFEDAPNGVQAALCAGMQAVMVPDAHLPENLRDKANLVLNSLEEFKPEEFGLPKFEDTK